MPARPNAAAVPGAHAPTETLGRAARAPRGKAKTKANQECEIESESNDNCNLADHDDGDESA